jgi:hypothetical protein
MHPKDAALAAVSYLRRLTPRGQQEEQELLHVIQSLSSFSNTISNGYTDRSVSNVM